MALFDPRHLIYHDYGGSPENKPETFNPYHALVFPDGNVRYRNPEAPYRSKAPHAFALNPKALGLSYAGPVGSQPTPQGMRALQNEYERIQSQFPGIPGMGHGEAFKRHIDTGDIERPSKDGRELQEASWRNRVTDLSRVPDTGLPSLSLLGNEPQEVPAMPAAPAVAGWQQPATPAAPMGAPTMGMLDAAQPEQPGFIDRTLGNPLTLMGLSILGAPHGNWGAGIGQGAAAAGQMAQARMRQSEYDEKVGQRRKLQGIWQQAFPGGQPNPEHPLLKGLPPEFAATVYAMGPEAGIAQLGELQMKGAASRLAADMERQKREEMMRGLQGMLGRRGQQPTVAPTGQPGVTGEEAFDQPGVMMPQPDIAAPGLATAAPGAAPTAMPGRAIPQPLPNAPTASLPGPQQSAAMPSQYAPGFQPGPGGLPDPLSDPRVQEQLALAIYGGDPKSLENVYGKALERADAPLVEGRKKYAEKRAEWTATEEEKTHTMREAWRLLDQVERQANALGDSRLSAAASPSLDTWFGKNMQRFGQKEAYSDRNQLLAYLDQLNVLARQQLKGQGTITDAESEMVGRALSSARNATDAATFRANINVARSILANKIPEHRNYVSPQLRALEDEQAARKAPKAAPAAPAAAPAPKDMVPPPKGQGMQVDRLDNGDLEGRTVYDNQTGRWGRVVGGKFVSMKELLKGKGTPSPWEQRPPASVY